MKDTDNNNGARHLIHMQVYFAKHLSSDRQPATEVTGYSNSLRVDRTYGNS